tara:strand:- start:1810 stop:2091 length:282 start_codon:yes stop_codon:yes gene_type:complete
VQGIRLLHVVNGKTIALRDTLQDFKVKRPPIVGKPCCFTTLARVLQKTRQRFALGFKLGTLAAVKPAEKVARFVFNSASFPYLRRHAIEHGGR